MNIEDIESQIAAAQSQIAALEKQQAAAQIETAKSYADAFIRKLDGDGIPLTVGLQAFRDLAKLSGAAKGRSAPRKHTSAVSRPVNTGVTYKNPATGEKWTAGPRGRTVGWLATLVAQGRPAADFEDS